MVLHQPTVLVGFAEHRPVGGDKCHPDLRGGRDAARERVEDVGIGGTESVAREVAGQGGIARQARAEHIHLVIAGYRRHGQRDHQDRGRDGQRRDEKEARSDRPGDERGHLDEEGRHLAAFDERGHQRIRRTRAAAGSRAEDLRE